MAATGEMKLEWVPLGEALRHERNPKDHDEALIRASVLRFGFNDPIAVNEATGKLLEGHGRLTVLQEMQSKGESPPERVQVREKDGEWLVPFIRGLSFEEESEAEAYMVAHNRASESGGWVDTLLGQMLKDFDGADEELWDAIGFTSNDATRFLEAAAAADGLGEEVGRGKLPEERLEAFLDGDIRQITILVGAEDYAKTLERLGNIMEAQKLVTHTAALMFLLDLYDAR